MFIKNYKVIIYFSIILIIILFIDGDVLAGKQTVYTDKVDQTGQNIQSGNPGKSENKYSGKIVTVSVRGANINDVLLMLTEQSGINLVPDETVQGQVTIELKEVEIMEALRTLTIAYGYHFDRIADNIFLVSREGFVPPAEINYQNGLLYIKVENGDIRQVVNQIAELTGINIIMNEHIQGTVSANLNGVPLDIGLSNFLQANGFSLSKNDNIYRIFLAGNYDESNLAISIQDGMVSIDVRQADLAEVLRTISRLSDINMVLFSGVRDVVDLKLDNIPVEDIIDIILSGTRFSYVISNGIYLVGDKNANSPSSSLLTINETIPLEFLEVEKVPALLPHNFPPANVKVLKEHNALLITGTQEEVDYIGEYIKKIDTKIPLIVVDALILELNKGEGQDPRTELGLISGYNEGNILLDSIAGVLTYQSVLDLPSDFSLKINNLIKNDLATIKARPNITTLNGQQAMIDVDTVYYYKTIKKDSDGNEETKYENVNGGVTLQVTPWVSSSGEITLNLKPSISNISLTTSAADSIPPVTRRTVETTVRVKDGQTIVIGGLIQDIGTNNKTGVPFLSDIPIFGQLFKSNKTDISQTELVIYITPHVLNTDEENVVEEMEAREEEFKQVYEEEF